MISCCHSYTFKSAEHCPNLLELTVLETGLTVLYAGKLIRHTLCTQLLDAQ